MGTRLAAKVGARTSSVAGLVVLVATLACTTNKYAGAGANAGAAAIIYAATGCKYAACPHGSTCSAQTGSCEPLPCGELGCGQSEECDEVRHECVPRGSMTPMTATTQSPPPSPTSPTASPGGP